MDDLGEKKHTLKPNKNASTSHTTYDFPMGPDNGKWWFLVVYSFFSIYPSVRFIRSGISAHASFTAMFCRQVPNNSECVICTIFRGSSHILCEYKYILRALNFDFVLFVMQRDMSCWQYRVNVDMSMFLFYFSVGIS